MHSALCQAIISSESDRVYNGGDSKQSLPHVSRIALYNPNDIYWSVDTASSSSSCSSTFPDPEQIRALLQMESACREYDEVAKVCSVRTMKTFRFIRDECRQKWHERNKTLQQLVDQTKTTAAFSILPRDVLLCIVEYLDAADLTFVPLWCRQSFEARDELVFGELLRRIFNSSSSEENGGYCYQQIFRSRVRALREQGGRITAPNSKTSPILLSKLPPSVRFDDTWYTVAGSTCASPMKLKCINKKKKKSDDSQGFAYLQVQLRHGLLFVFFISMSSVSDTNNNNNNRSSEHETITCARDPNFIEHYSDYILENL